MAIYEFQCKPYNHKLTYGPARAGLFGDSLQPLVICWMISAKFMYADLLPPYATKLCFLKA